MKKKKPLKVIAGAPDRPLVIGEIAIPCYVLEGEARVLSQRGLQSSIGLGTGGGKRQIGAPRLAEFVGLFARKGIDIHNLAARLEMPIKFQPPGGGRTAYGYPATLLVDLCNMVLEARKQGTLLTRQQRIAERCELLIRGFATVGIIALVDEATGYQAIRARRALATILEQFIAKALQPWTRTFPYEFYAQIFRLKGWTGPASVRGAARPGALYKRHRVSAFSAGGSLMSCGAKTQRCRMARARTSITSGSPPIRVISS